MIRLAAPSRRFWISAACLFLALGALPSHAHAQLTLTSFDIGASPNPVPDNGTTTFSAYVGGLSGTPSGSVTFYISASAATCTGLTDGNQIGTGDINSYTGVATVAYSAYTPGTIPICANYSGDYSYSPDTAGVYLLTVEQPPTFTVQVVGAAEAQTPVNFAFTISVPDGQPLPTGSVTIYDEGSGYSYGPVNINPDGSIPDIDGITLNDGYYNAQYSGDSNYQSQYVYGDVFQQNGLTAIIPDLIAAGSGDTTITLDGLNFDSSSVVAVAYSDSYTTFPTSYISPTQIQATIPQGFLTNAGTISLYVNTSDTGISTNIVVVQVNQPNSNAITVSSSPQTFAYGTEAATTFGSTITPSANDGGVPAGQVSYILTGPGVNQSIGSSQLTQNTSTSGTYTPAAPASLDAGSSKILSADLNNDGNFDFVSLPGYYPGNGGNGPYLQVMLSTGVNSFASEQEVYVGCIPQDFALGDINNDGFQDIVVACQNPDNSGGFPVAEYILGNGDGTFQAPVQFASNAIIGLITSPTQVVVGDFNGDGVLDVALIDGVNGNVQVLFSDNPFDGGYYASSQGSFDTSGGQVFSAAAADFNQDGLSDIALAEYNYDIYPGAGAVLVLTSNGYGGFNYTEQGFAASTYQMTSMVVTDVDGDGYPDIAVAEPGDLQEDGNDPGQVIVFENAEYGPGNLGTLNSAYSIYASQATDVTGVPFPATGAPTGTPAVAPGWNLLYASENPNNTQIFVTPLQRAGFGNWNTGNTLTTTEVIPDSDYITFPSYLTASDVNADGYLDFTLFGQDGNSNNQLETEDWSNAAATSLTGLGPIASPGNYTLAASYSGTPLFAGGSSATIPIVITQGTPTGAITGPSPASASAGTGVTVNVSIAAVPGGIDPTGSVTFSSNGSPISPSLNLSPSEGVSTATFTTSSLPIGLDTITAVYSGDTNYTATGSPQISSYQIQINGQTFSLGLGSSTISTTAGAMVSFTVTASGGTLPPPEPVTLTGLPTAVTIAPIMTNGVATYTYGQFPPGNYNIQASYAGDSTFLPQTSNIVSLQVSNTPVTVTPSPSANPVTYPTAINLNALVSSNGFGIPTGSVDFTRDPFGGSTDLGSGALSLVNGSSGLNQIGIYGGNADAALNDIATVSGDFNHDGIPDLAVLQQNSNVTILQVFIGNGDGTFQAPVTYGSAQSVAANSATLAAGDFNGDGYTDLAIGTSDGSILIFLATGDSAGDLAYSQGLTGNAEAGIAVGNFSPGNTPGLAVAGYSTVEVFTQSAPGTFNATPYFNYSTDGPQYAGITVADFNNDNAPDFAVSDSSNNNVAVFLNQPSNPDVPFAVSTYPVGVSAGAIASGDINGDNYPDLAVVSPTDSTVEVLINNQAGGFPTGTAYGVAGNPDAVTMADFNQDGYSDIAVTGTFTNQGGGTSILLGSPTGAMSGEVLLSGTNGTSIATADFNSDNNPDLAVGNNGVTTFLDATGQLALPNILLPAGSDTITATYTPAEGSVWAGNSGSFVETVNQGTPGITWPTPSPITYGTALSSTQLDATSPIEGTFTYTPAAGAVLDAGNQTLTVQFAPMDTVDYQPATAQVTLMVNQAVPTVTWSNPAAITYGTALSGLQLNASSPIQGSFSYTPALGTVLGAGTQTLSVTFTPTDATDYQAVTTSVSLVVNKATTSVTWNEPAAITYPAALSGTQLDATASVPGSFSYNPAAGTVLAAGSHSLSVTFTPTDTTDYQASTTTTSILVNKGSASVTWNNPAAITYGTALSATQLNATATVPGTFSYTPAAGTVLSAGTQTLNVTFTPTDTTDYQASTASVSIVVSKATTSVTWATPAAISYGTALSGIQLDATAVVPGTFNYTPGAGTVLAAGSHTLNVTFTPTDTTDYQTSTGSATILVNQATTTVTWATPAAINYGTALSATQLNATASVPGTFSYTPGSGTVLAAGTHTLNVTFTPTDTTDYQTSTGSVSIIVNKATTSITWANPAAITYGTALSAAQLNATAGVPGTFSYSPGAGTVLPAGTQTLNVTFTPTDTTDYQTSTASVSIVVSKATTSITWANPAAITYGTALSATQLDAITSVPGSFSYIPGAGTVLAAGTHSLNVTFTPTDTNDYQTSTDSVSILVNQATTSVTWANPASITYGTALSGTQLNATASVPGTFNYAPPAGTVLAAGTHTLNVTFTPTDAVDYQTSTGSVTVIVKQSATSINWNNPAAITYGTALSATQLNATSTIPGSFAYTPAAGTVLTAGTQTLNVTFTPTDTTDYQPSTASVTILVKQATSSVTWATPAAITYGTALSVAQLDATSTIPGSFAYTPTAGTVLAAGSHTLNVTFTPTDTTDYQTSTGSVTLLVNKATTSVTWANPAAITYGTTLSGTQLDATASVPGTFNYTPGAGTLLAAGSRTLNVTFTPTDTTDYQTATGSATILVNKATTSVTWNNPAAITYGTALSGTQLNATASVPGTFAYTPVAGTVLAAGTQTLNVTFTPTDTTDYQTSTASVSILVKQATSTITWANPAAITYGTALSATQLNATSTLPGSFSYTPGAGTVLTAGTQTLNVTFTPTDTTDYQTSTASVTIVVKQGTSSVTWATPAAITYGTALSGTQLDATASVPGTFAYTPAAGTVLTAGSHALNVTFTPTDTTDYKTATGSVTIAVSKATTSVTWANPAAITYGTALSATQLNATAGVPGTFVYTPAAGTVLTAGTHALRVTFTPTDTADYQTATGSASIVVNKATTSVTWINPAAVTYGTALSATQLNATASVPGTFVYTPAAGTVLAGGQHTLNVTFTPTDATDYQKSTAFVTIVVNKATTNVTWANPASITYGTALGAAQLNATASVPGSFAYTPSAGTVLTAGTQALNVTFTPTDSTDYAVSTASVSIVVKPAASTIAWANPAAITYGTALSSTQLDATSTVAGTFTYTPAAGTVLTAGSHTLSVSFAPTDTTDYQPSTATATLLVNKATTTVTWANPAAITYGTALGATQLDATSAVAGAFVYTPAAGTVLTAGAHSLSVSFTPTDTTDYLPSTGSASILVNKATPALAWITPQPIALGTALSATQLDATATPAGGTFVYDPPLGTILPIGNQTLSVTYTPVDTTDYTTASTTVMLVVGPDLALTNIAPSSGNLGQAATTITLTGVAFTSSSTVQLNGTAIASHFVNSTQMTAVIPASFFTQVQTGQVTVTSNGVTTPGLTFTVSATTVQATLSGPSTAQPGEQPTINFTLSEGYSLPLKGTFTLTVAPAVSGGPVDPAVQFSTGGTTLDFTIPAGSTTTPTVQIQTGTLAATITVTLTLTADGQNVTPDNIAPVVIDVPSVAPVITSVTLVRSGNSITVRVDGFSSTRDMSKAVFNFTPAGGATLSDSQVTVDVSGAFAGWYSLGISDQYGSAFSYVQTFTLSNGSNNIQSVSVTLTNSVGTSTAVSAN